MSIWFSGYSTLCSNCLFKRLLSSSTASRNRHSSFRRPPRRSISTAKVCSQLSLPVDPQSDCGSPLDKQLQASSVPPNSLNPRMQTCPEYYRRLGNGWQNGRHSIRKPTKSHALDLREPNSLPIHCLSSCVSRLLTVYDRRKTKMIGMNKFCRVRTSLTAIPAMQTTFKWETSWIACTN